MACPLLMRLILQHFTHHNSVQAKPIHQFFIVVKRELIINNSPNLSIKLKHQWRKINNSYKKKTNDIISFTQTTIVDSMCYAIPSFLNTYWAGDMKAPSYSNSYCYKQWFPTPKGNLISMVINHLQHTFGMELQLKCSINT